MFDAIKLILLGVMGASFGLLASAGVFTVFVAVGLIPRFADKTHTAKYVLLYEEMVVAGTLAGSLLSVYNEYCQFGAFWQNRYPQMEQMWLGAGNIILVIFGLFCGMFVGCLALAIAEMLDSLPILARRVSLRHGIGLAILAMAVGKTLGALFYFANELHRAVQ